MNTIYPGRGAGIGVSFVGLLPVCSDVSVMCFLNIVLSSLSFLRGWRGFREEAICLGRVSFVFLFVVFVSREVSVGMSNNVYKRRYSRLIDEDAQLRRHTFPQLLN